MSITKSLPAKAAEKTPEFTGQDRHKHQLSPVSKYVIRPAIWIILAALVVAVLYPLIWMILSSFKTSRQIFGDPFALPTQFNFDAYRSAIDQGVIGFFGNSLIVTVTSIVLVVLISSFAAYALCRLHIPFSGPLLMFILGGLMLAPTVALVPLFNLMAAIGLYDTRTALVILYVAFRIPFTTFLIRSYMVDLPNDIEEAATIDGAGAWRAFWQIIMPLCKPIIAAAAVLQVIFAWNEYAFALVFIDSPSKLTLPVGLDQMEGKLTTDWPALFAALVIAALPVIITFVIGQKQFVRGLTAGSNK
ncbi:carbohydrate ABC transporter permease [Spelaeicoccus albus]|uniref:Raffinose/stachyose/melibiose transport system permease protein n=1 Tax=Spelaeicoccus albus TaxID=1280376 RepID=A0A7Z0D265_9MICO|nr:carbohydrate ABC transporter permease [Spelaeicoccus albus]NYI67485.1 raffinose/stachyose/melibiose transport system permease protein [Spelaeicoccus albus]